MILNLPLLFRRWRSLRERRRRARRFHIVYRRDKDWRTPSHLQILWEQEPLALPDDLGTRIAFKDIFISDVYGLEGLTRAPTTILDVGAHAGLFSLAARLYFPEATIHAYQPNPAPAAAQPPSENRGFYRLPGGRQSIQRESQVAVSGRHCVYPVRRGWHGRDSSDVDSGRGAPIA